MTSKIIPVEPFDYVVFGATGDLAARKLIPALFRRFIDGQFSDGWRIIGASRSQMSDDEYRDFVRESLERYVSKQELMGEQALTFVAQFYYVSVDAKSERGWAELKALLANSPNICAYYLAVGPSLFGEIAQRLSDHQMITPRCRLVIEKPFGHDLQSAKDLNAQLGRCFNEDQIYRIDHYLGKETVQNLLALRFANSLYEPIWNNAHIDHIQISVSETVGVESRGNYYNKSGALRDMVQNHLLQLLCLVAMEPPFSATADAVRDEKLKILRALSPIIQANADRLTVRGQYRSGAIHGEAVAAYLDEIDDDASATETFVAIKAEVDNWRWAGVPIYMRTGKRLPVRMSEISIQFKPVPHNIFPDQTLDVDSNRLVLRLQPDEGVKQWITIKDPGPGGMRLRNIALDMSFSQSVGVRSPDAYERLLLDVIRGNATLFMRRDEVEAAWQWIDPIAAAWSEDQQKTHHYTAGTWGPSAAIALCERDGRSWHEDLD